MHALEPLRGLAVLDEIQHEPELFPVLRVLTDRPRRLARFLVLGNASPELLDLRELVVVHSGEHSFDMAPKIRAVAAGRILEDLRPLR